MHKGIVVVFVLLIVLYILTSQKRLSKVDTSLLTVSVIALTWKYLNSKTIIEGNHEKHENIEHYLDEPQSLLDILDSLKPITDEENFKPISKNLVLYYTTFNSLSYTPNTKEWRNVIDTTKTKSGELKCNSSMYFDLLPSFSKVLGFTLGPNKLTGPFSNTLGINFRGQYSVVMAFKHGNLQNDTTQYGKIELFKLWANSPNNNGMSLFIEAGSLQFVNNTQFGKLMFQYADYSPVHCKISKDDDLIPIEANILCFVFIVKLDDKVRVMYMTERSNNVNTLAQFNVATTDVTFSNKEMAINRFGNWNSNLFNYAVYGNAVSDVTITNIYQHIKNLYIATNDPSYRPVVNKYNETIDKLNKFISCPFDEKTCKSCEGVKEWNDISQVITAPSKCRKAISAFCKTNVTHPFCKCWDKKNDSFNTSSCKALKSVFEDDSSITLTRAQYNKLKTQCKGGRVRESGVEFDDSYTFEKVRVKYEDGLTTKERVAQGMEVELPEIMTSNDYQQGLATSSMRLEDASYKTKKSDNKLMNAIMKGNSKDNSDDNEEGSDGGLWSIFKWFS
jgi:hypothetical protein